jgi:alkylhydroperoxidase/carboxymuconolactone decarboxylase family protein YurZ
MGDPVNETDGPEAIEDERRRRVLDSMSQARGHRVTATWEWVAGMDIDFLEVYAPLSNAQWSPPFQRTLEPKYRELIAIVLLANRGYHWSLSDHIRRAMRLGATPLEVLEFLEATVIPGGAPILQLGLRHLMEVIEEDQIEGRPDPRESETSMNHESEGSRL